MIVSDTASQVKNNAGSTARRIRANRGMSLEDRRNLNYVASLNSKFHKLQPYFDLISAYYWDIMQQEKFQTQTGVRTGSVRSPKTTKKNTPRRESIITNMN